MDESGQENTEVKKEYALAEIRNVFSDNGAYAMNLFLTAKGVRPACTIDFANYPGEDYPKVAQCHTLLKDLGITFKYKKIKFEGEDYEMQMFFVGKDEDHLERLIEADETRPFDSKKFGDALGYPETAIQAFKNGKLLNPKDYPQELRNDPALPFCTFSLSRDHWKEEMEFVRKQAEYIKKENPKFYEFIATGSS